MTIYLLLLITTISCLKAKDSMSAVFKLHLFHNLDYMKNFKNIFYT